jgi:hypothetical protein
VLEGWVEADEQCRGFLFDNCLADIVAREGADCIETSPTCEHQELDVAGAVLLERRGTCETVDPAQYQEPCASRIRPRSLRSTEKRVDART